MTYFQGPSGCFVIFVGHKDEREVRLRRRQAAKRCKTRLGQDGVQLCSASAPAYPFLFSVLSEIRRCRFTLNYSLNHDVCGKA